MLLLYWYNGSLISQHAFVMKERPHKSIDANLYIAILETFYSGKRRQQMQNVKRSLSEELNKQLFYQKNIYAIILHGFICHICQITYSSIVQSFNGKKYATLGGRHSSVVLSAPTILQPRALNTNHTIYAFSICIIEIVVRKERK